MPLHRELAGDAAAVENKSMPSWGSAAASVNGPRPAAQRSLTPRRGSKYSKDSSPGRERNELAPWRLRVEAGLFIGTVLVRWLLPPSGHPVVHLAENTDLDIALGRARLEIGAPDLRTVLPYAESLKPGP